MVVSSSARCDAQKKTLIALERDRDDVAHKRRNFQKYQYLLPMERLVFVDESGFRLGTPPHYGWAKRGLKCFGKHIASAWKNVTMIGAIALDGFRGFMNIESGTSGDVFVAYVQQQLAPNLRKNDIVVMDNLSAHKRADVIKAINAVGAWVIFVPPYSPDYNPIERMWSKLKESIRRQPTTTRKEFDTAVAKAMNQITKEDILAWTKFAGYTFSAS